MDIDNMSADELKAYIIEKREKLRQSQRKYVESRKSEGHHRINAFITPEAANQLKRLKRETGKNVGDIISDLLCNLSIYNDKKSIETSPTQTAKKHKIRANISGDKEAKTAAEKRIKELASQGLGTADIVRALEKEGIKSATGLTTWRRGTVHRIVKRLKDAG